MESYRFWTISLLTILSGHIQLSNSWAQNDQYNYIMQQDYKIEANQIITSPSKDQADLHIQYFDGLGRPIQSLAIAAAPSGQDIVQVNVYDNYGRETRQYLPFVTSGTLFNNGNYVETAIQSLEDFYNDTSNSIANTLRPYAETRYRASASGIVLEKGFAGEAWQINSDHTNTSDHTIESQTFYNNLADSILHWIVDPWDSLSLLPSIYYQNKSLTKKITIDEHQNFSIAFIDVLGRTIQEQWPDVDGRKVVTCFVYDDLNNLRYVLPPEFIYQYSQGIPSGQLQKLIDKYAYIYQYDGRGRLVEKKLPGIEPKYMVYDKLDRLVLTQDGNLRDDSKWFFTKYDGYGREAYFGIYENTNSRQVVQAAVNEHVSDALDLFETRDKCSPSSPQHRFVGGMNIYYTNEAFPTDSFEILTVKYYDDYCFNPPVQVPDTNDFGEIIVLDTTGEVKGLLTGLLEKIFGMQDSIVYVYGYDRKGRLIWASKTNSLFATTETAEFDLDFQGRILKTKKTILFNGVDVEKSIHEYSYDHAGRQTIETITLNSQPPITVTFNQYNELGQLNIKHQHKITDGIYGQSIDYNYNIRGWLDSINSIIE